MELLEICQRAKSVKYEVQKLSTEDKNRAHFKVSECLQSEAKYILDANSKDYENGLKNG